jgi:hypothetical protein
MKRSLFIIGGVILVVVLIIVWIYVLFIGNPTNTDEQFANFNLEDTTDLSYEEPTIEESSETVVDVSANQRLRQLTTRPVAGFIEVQTSTTSSIEVRYVEVGTGHVYSINLETGAEERISGTTIPSARKAVFSKDGRFIMIESGFGTQKEFIIGEIFSDTSSLTNTAIAEPVVSFSASKDNRFLYAIQTGSSVIGKIFNPEELTSETLFSLPFREASFEWGKSVSDAHYVYPKTTRQLESFLYQVKNGVITRMPIDGYGMSALGNSDYILYSKQEKDQYNTYYFDTKNGSVSISPLVQIPEKCVMTEGRFPITICASSQYEFQSLLPDTWYKGEVSSADNLWEHTLDESSAKLLVNTKSESGRELDIINLSVSDDGFNVYFSNQNDQTLWMYERLVTNQNRN